MHISFLLLRGSLRVGLCPLISETRLIYFMAELAYAAGGLGLEHRIGEGLGVDHFEKRLKICR